MVALSILKNYLLQIILNFLFIINLATLILKQLYKPFH